MKLLNVGLKHFISPLFLLYNCRDPRLRFDRMGRHCACLEIFILIIAIKKSSPGQTVDDLEKEKLLDGKALTH